ncbi:MAG: YgiQ family radical SAM protein, partial [Planctomycetes bacterium]|nr:YgiQ family radical SAM protein [Planctomycetota bacterium]
MASPCSTPDPAQFLPTTAAEMQARGWDAVDVVFVSGDAYVDHPSFAAALLGRVLEAEGFRVAILPQPAWQDAGAFRQFGRPRLCFAVSAGNMDSMINHYTANKKRRNDDAYSPGGRIELRPDRATNVYAQRCREAFPGVPVVAGGVEASLRRIAHFDYWSETVRPSILVTSKADLVGFGMGERVLLEICRRLRDGRAITDCRDLRGVAYLLGGKETLPAHEWHDAACDNRTVELPSFEQVKADKVAFATATRLLHHETNPQNGRRLTQRHGDRVLVVNPPALALDEAGMDRIYDLPYTRKPHPRYREPIPAHTMIKDSITTMRGCFGGCTFCSITMHQGRAIQSRSHDSVVREARIMASDPEFKGHISDVGGPTANMYRMRCTRPEVEAKCRRLSCVHPTVCKLLGVDHGPTKDLLQAVRETPGVKSVRVASGIRMDLARFDDEYLQQMATHHVGGQLKVAPEHVSEKVLALMKKPATNTFEEFADKFAAASARAGKEQYLIPYFIASHPGSSVHEMIELAVFLQARGYRPRQVQDFIPAPMDIATCMYHTGLDPMTMRPVETVKKLKDREVQRALMQFFKPENWFLVHRALLDAGRKDLIGTGPQCLIKAEPPKAALQARRDAANGRRRGDPTYVHAKDAGV